jgi:hypothetical protein
MKFCKLSKCIGSLSSAFYGCEISCSTTWGSTKWGEATAFKITCAPQSAATFYSSSLDTITDISIWYKSTVKQFLIAVYLKFKLFQSESFACDRWPPTSRHIRPHRSPFRHESQFRYINNKLIWEFRLYYYIIFKGETFSAYNYGYFGNLRHYGSLRPPSYDLSKVTTPVYLFYGSSDYLSTSEVL